MHAVRPAGRRRIPWPIFIAPFVLALGAVVWFLFLSESAPLGGDPDVPDFSFELTNVEQVAVADEAGQEAIDEAAAEIHTVLDGVYAAGFVDPTEWKDGTFPAVLEAFGGRAANRADKDLAELTLGEESRHVKSVEPRPSKLSLGFLVDEQGDPYGAVGRARFRARAELKQGGRGLRIVHTGRYLLRRIDGGWKIVGYDVTGELEGQPRAPAGGEGG